MANARRFKQTQVPRQTDEFARLKVVQGADYGAVYVITAAKASVGRGEENDVVISDLKASRLHASLSLSGAVWEITDLGSANGILHNGKALRKTILKTNDTFTLGETTLEFITSEVGTSVLMAPAKSPIELQGQNSTFNHQKEKIKKLASIGGSIGVPLFASSPALAQKKPKPWLLGALGLGAVLIFFVPTPNSGTSSKKKRAPASVKETDLGQYLPQDQGLTANKTAEQFFKAGFREYRNGNYLRARTQFETVLQMAPAHTLAIIYLENCNKKIEDDVKTLLETGRRDLEAGKLRSAKGNFEAVMRLLFKEQTNPAFLEAREQLERVTKEERSSEGSG